MGSFHSDLNDRLKTIATERIIVEDAANHPYDIAGAIQRAMTTDAIFVNVRTESTDPSVDTGGYPTTTNTVDVRKHPRGGSVVTGIVREAGEAVLVDDVNVMSGYRMDTDIAKFLIVGAYLLSKSFFRKKDPGRESTYREYSLTQLLSQFERRWDAIFSAIHGW